MYVDIRSSIAIDQSPVCCCYTTLTVALIANVRSVHIAGSECAAAIDRDTGRGSECVRNRRIVYSIDKQYKHNIQHSMY